MASTLAGLVMGRSWAQYSYRIDGVGLYPAHVRANFGNALMAVMFRGWIFRRDRSSPRFAARLVGHLGLFFLFMAVPPHAYAGELHDAARNGDVDAVRALMADGADFNESDFMSGPPIHLAVMEGHVAVAEVLIAAGADLEAVGEIGGAHPLHTAARNNRAAMVALLMDRGALFEAKNTNGQTPLIVAAVTGSRDAAEALLSKGADVNGADDFKGMTALQHAAFSGRIEIVKLLLSRGADVNVNSGTEGATPLHHAIGGGAKHDLIKLLVAEGADLNARDESGLTPMVWAEQYALPDTSELLRSLGARE
jgi:ankyrin repeat protein